MNSRADTIPFANPDFNKFSISEEDSLNSDNNDEIDYRVITLDGLEVMAKHYKYSTKNNPAYELMKKIRKTKYAGDARYLPEYHEDFYTKIVLGLNNCDASEFTGKDKFKFLEEYVDTAKYTNLPVLLISLREKAGTKVHSLDFRKDKIVVKGERSVGIDESFNQDNITLMLEEILKNVNIYNDDIDILQHHFVSPISSIADNFYRYYLNDTVEIDGKKHIELTFAPVSPESFGFNGRLYVEAEDSTYFIRKLEMKVPRVINLNFVDNVCIRQEYYKDEFGKRHIQSDDMELELSLMPGTQPFYARRLTNFRKPEFTDNHNLHNILYDASEYIVYEKANLLPWDKWNDFRLVPLSKAEGEMGSFMNRMRRFPFIFWSEKILKMLLNGYVATSPKDSKFDLGPINTLLSYNSIEGWRIRIGGLTTAKLSDRWFGRAFVAYGFRDHKVKYLGELEYSFISKNRYARDFPVNSLRINYQYDLDEIGQHYVVTSPDNIFLSLKREACRLALYRREAGFSYQIELKNNFSFIGSFRHRIYEATPWMPFNYSDGRFLTNYTLAGFMVEFRYAPGEKFTQGATNRYRINKDAPIFLLTHEFVPKGMLGSQFTFNKTELSVSKRFWFSAFGFLDCIFKLGKVWSTVDYPQLIWQNANLSFTIQPESYSLLNPMEFPMDYFGSLDFSYNANGLLFNRIPLIKRFKLREVFTFKGFMGGLTSKNDPLKNRELLQFPSGTATGRLSAKPYMEFSAGIDNILSFLRVDYVWRLTYRNMPDISHGGVRLSANFTF